MDGLSGALQALTSAMGPYAPRTIGALVMALGAWLAARLLRSLVRRAGSARQLDDRLKSPGLTEKLGGVVYWLVWLVALPGLLGAVQLEGLLVPVQAMVARMLSFLPNLLGAAAVFAIGLLAATIVRQVVSGLLTVAGSERLAARLGLGSALGKDGLAGLLSLLVFILILLPVVAAALQPLGLDAVTQPVSRLLETVMALIPRLIAALIVVTVAALGGRALSSMASAMLAAAGIDSLPARLGLSATLRLGGRSPAELAGACLMLAVMMVAITQASEILGFPIITTTIATLGEVLARLAAALFVALLGAWLAAVAAQAIAGGSFAHARRWGSVARVAILFFTAALALRQAGLPAEIVTIAFAAVVGAMAVGAALAIGIGGRHVAGRLLENLVASFEKPAAESDPPRHDA